MVNNVADVLFNVMVKAYLVIFYELLFIVFNLKNFMAVIHICQKLCTQCRAPKFGFRCLLKAYMDLIKMN